MSAVLLSPAQSEQRTARVPWPAAGGWLVVGVFLLALLPRVWTFDWQLPSALYFDELKYVTRAVRFGSSDPNEVDFRNPSLFRHLLSGEFAVLGMVSPAYLPPTPATREQASIGARLAAARITVAILGALAVALLYLTAASLWGCWAGLAAGLLYAAAFLPVHLSHLALNDVPASCLLGLGLWCSARALCRPDARWLAGAGLAIGLAAATKYNFAIGLAAPLAAAWFGPVGLRPRAAGLFAPALLGRAARNVAIVGGAAILGFVLGMPEVIVTPADVMSGFAQQLRTGNSRWPGQEPDPVPALYGRTLLQGIGLPALLLSLAGAMALVWRRPAQALMLLAPPLLYLGAMFGKPLFFARFALPVVPFVCLLAVVGIRELVQLAPPARLRPALAIVLTLVALGPSIVLSARHDDLITETDTRLEAQDWLRAHAPAGTKVAAQLYSLPIAVEGYPRTDPWQEVSFDSLTDAAVLRRLACQNARYLLVSSYRYERQRTTSRPGESPTGYELLDRGRPPVVTFAAGPGGTAVRMHVDDTALPFWSLWQRERPGPTVRIYELARPASGGCPGQ
ncbi:MAG: glycosyltransferase family 39 protein [Chloroflexi bacterium]|nr:glycosyltransferase family 39 protein [Chloroflexota bacterium]